MKKIIFCCFLMVSLVIFPVQIATAQDVQTNTTVIVVRHAEKAGNSENPNLTELGEKRAETLAHMLSQSGVSAVFSTKALRTMETANNYANTKGIDIENYDSETEVCNKIKSEHAGEKVLVVGHSNTIPRILEACGVKSAPLIGDEYNNLFVMTIPITGSSSLIHLKYETQPLNK